MRIPNEETTDRMAARARDALLARRLWRGCAGTKRIVFSNDGLIYYTEDHYKSFELLYGEE